MSQIVHLDDGTAIKADVVKSFTKAIANPLNLERDGSMNWNFVDADMHLDLSGVYSSDYIYGCFIRLAENMPNLMKGELQ